MSTHSGTDMDRDLEEEYEDKACSGAELLLVFSRAASQWLLRRNVIESDDPKVATPMLSVEGEIIDMDSSGWSAQDIQDYKNMMKINEQLEPAAIYGVRRIDRMVDEYNATKLASVHTSTTSDDQENTMLTGDTHLESRINVSANVNTRADENDSLIGAARHAYEDGEVI